MSFWGDIRKVYIFGAGSRAKTLKGYLQFLYPQADILAFLVDNREENEELVDNIPVRLLKETEMLEADVPVCVATKGIYHDEIQARLKQKGSRIVIPVTVELDNFFRNEYVRKYYAQEQCRFVKIEELSAEDKAQHINALIYVTKSIYDKPLQSDYVSPFYERTIQAGAALTSERLEADILTDCEGDNISSRNRQYCELTALYWLWKHAEEDVVGLAHYRRHFILPNEWMGIMKEHKIDVILPVPTYVSPSIAANYKERHDPSDWDYLMEYLRERKPEDYDIAQSVFDGNLYFPCNMFIMRREVLDRLCAWMFPILDAVTEHGGVKKDVYLNRYPGFLSERLITLFFHMTRDEYNVIYADKIFLN